MLREKGFRFCGKHLLMIRIQVSNPGSKVPLVFLLANSVDPNEMTYYIIYGISSEFLVFAIELI